LQPKPQKTEEFSPSILDPHRILVSQLTPEIPCATANPTDFMMMELSVLPQNMLGIAESLELCEKKR